MRILHKKIEEIAEVIAGQSPPSSTYNKEGKGLPFFQGKADYGVKYPKVRFWCSEPTKISLPDDILISVRAPVGPVNINDQKSCIGRGLTAIRVNNDISRDYVYFFLKINESRIAKLGVGSTFTSITQKDVKALVIPIPDNLEDQIRIANILSKAEALISQRKESLRLLDELLKSTFLEMFGFDYNKEGKWNIVSFGEVIKDLSDYHANGSYEALKEVVTLKKEDDFALMVRTTDLENNNFNKDCNYIDERAYNFLSKSKIFGGEIIINKIGSAGKVYLMPYLNRPVSLGMNAFLLRFTEAVNNVFVFYLLTSKYGADSIQRHVKGAVTKTITKDAVRSIAIPLPPLKLQTQFAHIVEKTEALKAHYQTSLQELENLYGSLSQRAFKGELNISDDELAMAAEPSEKYKK